MVIAGDKSTDRTIPIINGFKGPRIKVVEKEQNLGLGRNWNKVLSSVQGESVKLLGAADANASAGKQGHLTNGSVHHCAREISFDSVAGDTPRTGQMP